MKKRILGVIPARYKSTRFPGKPLVDIAGKSMIQRVYERCSQSQGLATVLVATDDDRIAQAVNAFGGRVEMTDPAHPTGTDRLLEIAARFPDYDAYINIQGDEPLIDPRQIDALCEIITTRTGEFVGTLIKSLDLQEELHNPNVIKVVREQSGKAIYFSRLPIPYLRDPSQLDTYHQETGFFKHIGMYGYSREAVAKIRTMAPGSLEKAESLEQLRWLENGMDIWTAETGIETKGVDVPEDVQVVLDLLKEMKLD